MSTSEVMELVARIRPEGLDDTADSLEDVEESFEETAETAAESSEDLETFSNRFEGAIGVAVGALAVGVGGLLSTVPIVGEAFAGIGALLEAFGLQLDNLLRRLGVNTNFLFVLANAVATAEGPFAILAGVVAGVTSAIAGLVAALGVSIPVINALFGTSLTLSGVLTTVATAIAGVIGGISAATAALALLVVGVIAFAAAFITNFRGTRDVTISVISEIINALLAINQFFIDVLPIAFQTGVDITINTLKQWGNRLISLFESTFNSAERIVVDKLNSIGSIVERQINDAINTINRLTGANIGNVSIGNVSGSNGISLNRFQTTTTQAIRQRGRRQLRETGALETAQDFASAVAEGINQATGETVIQIDGREVARTTEPYLASGTTNRVR